VEYLNLRERKKWHTEENYTTRKFVIGILYQIFLRSEKLMGRDILANLAVDGRRILKLMLTNSVLLCGPDSSCHFFLFIFYSYNFKLGMIQL
jgi:hypothetical protein